MRLISMKFKHTTLTSNPTTKPTGSIGLVGEDRRFKSCWHLSTMSLLTLLRGLLSRSTYWSHSSRPFFSSCKTTFNFKKKFLQSMYRYFHGFRDLNQIIRIMGVFLLSFLWHAMRLKKNMGIIIWSTNLLFHLNLRIGFSLWIFYFIFLFKICSFSLWETQVLVFRFDACVHP